MVFLNLALTGGTGDAAAGGTGDAAAGATAGVVGCLAALVAASAIF